MDYSSWTVRLETYDTRKWPGDAPQYIKDLVEAGLVYSGEKDIVFCFKCGVVISCWHEDDSPLDKHENMSPLCPYLQERNATKCALSLRDADVAGMGFPQASRRIVSLEDCERASYLFDWVPGHGVVYVKCSLLNKENMPDINNCRQNTSSMLSGNGLSSVPRCVGIFNADMVSEEARLRTFFYASPRKDWPVPERLAQAGFYFGGYEEDRDDVICHCCGLALKSWGNREIDPLEVHRELAKECAFVRELDTAGGDNVGVDARSSSPENVKTSASLLEGEAVPAFFSRPSLHRILSQESDPGLSESLESSKKLNVVLPSRPLLVTPTSCDAQGFGETNGESSCAQMSPFAQTSSSAQMSPCSQMSPCAQTPHAVARSPTYALVMPHGDLSEISKRLVTFVTWPVHSTMEPVELAKAGFYYLGRDDCVKCYKCGVTIRSWEPSDEAWAEHKRHSPFCELVIQKTREDLGMVQDYHFQRQPAAVGRPRENPPLPPLRSSLQPLLMPSPTSVTLRPSPRLMPAEFSPYQARSEPQMRPTTPEPRPLPPVFSRSPDQAPSSLPGLRVASPRSPYEISAAQAHYNHGKEDSFRVSAHPKVNNAVHAVRSVESSGPGWTGTNVNLSCSPVQTHAALPCAQFSSTKLNDAVMPPLPLPRYGLAGSHSCNYTDLEIDRLLDLGLLRADIEGTLRDRLALCGQSFQSLDDFAAAALFYQERKTLAGSPWCVPSEQRKCVPTDEQSCLSTEERKRVLTEQLNVRAAKSPEIPCSSPPEPSDSQACKICMDAFVSVLFIPCGHLVTCATCAETLKLCPICRSEIRSTHKAFLS